MALRTIACNDGDSRPQPSFTLNFNAEPANTVSTRPQLVKPSRRWPRRTSHQVGVAPPTSTFTETMQPQASQAIMDIQASFLIAMPSPHHTNVNNWKEVEELPHLEIGSVEFSAKGEI
ncbi:hypothetical protein V5O48_006358 [Marasmius crinis-equi]|uniref:Uncharacterized protein n=1 Tax=Marasmius crinis-equi TaxID=585013 RepID=A0ABR3FJP9_9AGAR